MLLLEGVSNNYYYYFIFSVAINNFSVIRTHSITTVITKREMDASNNCMPFFNNNYHRVRTLFKALMVRKCIAISKCPISQKISNLNPSLFKFEVWLICDPARESRSIIYYRDSLEWHVEQWKGKMSCWWHCYSSINYLYLLCMHYPFSSTLLKY